MKGMLLSTENTLVFKREGSIQNTRPSQQSLFLGLDKEMV